MHCTELTLISKAEVIHHINMWWVFGATNTNTHLLGEVVVHLIGHGDSLVICCNVVLQETHALRGAACVGFNGGQNSTVVLPVGGQLLEDQSLLVCFSLQGVYPHCTGGKKNRGHVR